MTGNKPIWYVTHSSGFDYKTELYDPIKNSELFVNHKIILPHDQSDKPENSEEWIREADLILAEVSYPSTGQGIELGWASKLGKKIICFHRKELKPSGSLSFISDNIFVYVDGDDLIKKLETL